MEPHTTSALLSRRDFVRTTSALAATALTGGLSGVAEVAAIPASAKLAGANQPHPFLTPAGQFRDVSRSNPKSHTLTGDALVQARHAMESAL